MSAVRILIFYHVFNSPNTQHILLDQVSKLLYSGLYASAENIYCSLSGDRKYGVSTRKLLESAGSKFVISQDVYNDNSYERLTLLDMKKYVRPSDKVLYIHTKGVSHSTFSLNIYYWRSFMEYFLVKQFAHCLLLLDSYDVVGVNYKAEPRPHFSGNFWWARGDYLLRLPDTIGKAYHDPEFYLFLEQPRYFVLRDSQVSHYEAPYPYINYTIER